MLIVTRRIGESCTLVTDDGTEIKVYAMGVNGNQVKIGFNAPKTVNILRDEVEDDGRTSRKLNT